MSKIVRFLIKLIAVPVFLFLSLFSLLGKIAARFSAYATGIPLLILVGIFLYCLFAHRWMDAVIVAVVGIVILTLLFAAMYLAQIIGEWASRLFAFLRS